MVMLHRLFMVLMLSLVCFSLAGCATAPVSDKVPSSVWAQLADGQSQDLIVEFADSASKQAALLALPLNQFEVLKDYEKLPLMYIRFRSGAALKALLANPLVVNAYEDRQEDLMPQKEVRQ